MWHALGAVNKFSLQAAGKVQGRDLGVSQAMCMHKNYNYVLAPSEATGEFYCEAFGCSKDKIKILNLPRVDIILNGENKKSDFLKLNPEYSGKKTVAYIPTFRNNDEEFAEKLLNAFKNCDDYKLAISPHPLSDAAKSGKYSLKGDFSSLDIMKMADVIITDYSACAFEGALLEKPLYFYIPDYEIYKAEQGLNFDMKKEMPLVSFESEAELIYAIKNNTYDFNMLSDFCRKYVEYKKTDNTERLAQFICSLSDER